MHKISLYNKAEIFEENDAIKQFITLMVVRKRGEDRMDIREI